MLFAIAIAGAVVASGSVVWHHEAQRERERELLRIGNEFRIAIGVYYQRSPGSAPRYPEKLEDLMRDDRHLSLQRYLRRIYRDPMTGTQEWGVVSAPQGGIMGVYSRSEGQPVKTGGFDERDAAFADKVRYSEWRFVYTPPSADPAVSGAEPGAGREPPRPREPRTRAPVRPNR
jgi:hypothetical protein